MRHPCITWRNTSPPTVSPTRVTLHKTTGAQLEGWNLIGNPFGTSATINKVFYRMNPETHAEIIPADNSTVDAMEGIFVVADTDGETTPHSSLSSGVYVLRLINGEETKTQKVVIPSLRH